MNSRMKMLLGIAGGTFLFGMAITFAWADGGAACRGDSHAMGMARHGVSNPGGMTSHVLHSLLRNQSSLGLTEDQVTKLNALALDQDRAQIQTRADIQVANRELRALVTGEKTELSIIEAKIKERESIEANVRNRRPFVTRCGRHIAHVCSAAGKWMRVTMNSRPRT